MSPTGDVASTMLGTIVPHTVDRGSSDSKEPSMRALVTVAAGATLAMFTAFTGTVHAVEYDFVSVDASGGSLSQFTRTLPSVNVSGATAFAAPVYNAVSNRDDYVVFRSDGAQLTAVLNLTDAVGPGTPSSVVINDAGAIAVNYAAGSGAVILRIAADGSFSALARADLLR